MTGWWVEKKESLFLECASRGLIKSGFGQGP